jgi:hypothetical protein
MRFGFLPDAGFPLEWLGDMMKKPKPDPKKPGQHEDQLASLARIEEALKKQISIEIKCSCCAETQKGILKSVQNIESNLAVNFKLIKEIIMASKAEVEAKIAEVQEAVNSGFATLGQTLVSETQQVIDAINAGGDNASTLASLEALKTSITDKVATLNTGISDIVTPPAPPPPPVEPSARNRR